MLASITPLGERGRGAVWWRTVAAYTAGSVLGGAVLGAVLGGLGALLVARLGQPAASRLAPAAGVLALVAAAADLAGRLPTIRRQVDERWLVTYRDWVYGAGFGVQLGLGAVTIVTSASVYLTWVLELACGSAAGGAAVGAVFGLARALPLLAFRGAVDADGLRRRHRRWQGRLVPVARATVAVQAAAALALLGAGTGGLT